MHLKKGLTMPHKIKKSAAAFLHLSKADRKTLARLNSPAKIQDYLNSLPMNFSDDDPCFCVQQVLHKQTAHCFEGALLAAAALWYHGRKPLLLDLTTTPNDEDHVVAIFRGGPKNKFWGAISKTNHAVLRYREPVYSGVRELAMSYFHEYFLNSTGQKTLRTFSKPFDLSKPSIARLNWLTSQQGIMELIQKLADSPHNQILSPTQIKTLRKADKIEIKAGKLTEY